MQIGILQKKIFSPLKVGKETKALICNFSSSQPYYHGLYDMEFIMKTRGPPEFG
jgi:hypothetical protein